MNCTYLGWRTEWLHFFFPYHTPPPMGGLLHFLIKLASISLWLNSQPRKRQNGAGKLDFWTCMSLSLEPRTSCLQLGHDFQGQGSLGINRPQELGPSTFPEQCFSTRATLATRRNLTAPGMVRLSQLACSRCWWHQVGGSQDADQHPPTHRTPLPCRTMIAAWIWRTPPKGSRMEGLVLSWWIKSLRHN